MRTPDGLFPSPGSAMLAGLNARFYILIFCFGLFHGGPGGLLHADIQLPRAAGPMVTPISVEVEPGGTIEIPLSGATAGNAELEFFVREGPRTGKVGAVRRLDRRRAVVSYTHNGSMEGDRFRYAARASGLPVSPSAEVRIIVKRTAPTLGPLPEFIDFGTLFAGDRWPETITLSNSGEGVLRVRLKCSEPWIISGPTELQLRRGRPAVVRIEFAPNAQREYSGHLEIAGDINTLMRLHGEGLSPFALSKEMITIPANPDAVVESILIANITGEDREIAIETTENLSAPPALAIPMDGEHPIPFHYRGDPAGSGSGEVIVHSGNWFTTLRVTIEPGPAKMEFLSEPIELGTLEAGRVHLAEVRIRNAGGKAGTARLVSTHPGISISRAEFEIERGETVVIPIEVAQSQAPGAVVSALQLTWIDMPENGALALPLTAEIRATSTRMPGGVADASPAATPGFATQTTGNIPRPVTDMSAFPEDEAFNGSSFEFLEPITFEPTMPRVKKIGSSKMASDGLSCLLTWEPPPGGPFQYAVDLQYVTSKAQGEPLVSWWTLTEQDFKRTPSGMQTTLRELGPGGAYVIRVRVLDAAGRSSLPSESMRIRSPWKEPVVWWPWLLLLIPVGAAAGLYLRRRNQLLEVAGGARRDLVSTPR